jgi:hypothetical protein
MSEREPITPKSRRRRFAVSMRMLMLLVLVAGAALGWKVNRVQAQKRAVARIRDVGGDVTYELRMIGTSLSDAAVGALTAAIPNLVLTHHQPTFFSMVPPNARIESWMRGKKSKH